MGRVARSAMGQIVDFDLIAIRQQLASAPPPVEVTTRREYIDNKEAGRPIKDTLLNPIGVQDDAEESEFEDESHEE